MDSSSDSVIDSEPVAVSYSGIVPGQDSEPSSVVEQSAAFEEPDSYAFDFESFVFEDSFDCASAIAASMDSDFEAYFEAVAVTDSVSIRLSFCATLIS